MKWSLLWSTVLCVFTGTVQAQGLIWSLPEDGQWVRYEGTYTQVIRRPDSAEGDLTLTWRRATTLKSVGKAQASYQGKSQACRWLEIKSETGKAMEGVIEAGPGEVRIYKILVPESAIRGEVFEEGRDSHPILVSSIPVLKGSRKIGDGPVEKIESGVFDLYPLVSLLRHYRDFDATGDAASLQVTAGTFSAKPYHGEMQTETSTQRFISTADVNRGEEIPFGVVKWTATSTAEAKGSTDDRSAFHDIGSVKEEMEAVRTGGGAEAELVE